MEFIHYLSLLFIVAYLLLIFLGVQQMKDCNKRYQQLRQRGKVSIGKKKGYIQAETIVMFAVDENEEILEAIKMQGISVLARFKEMNGFYGENIHNFPKEHFAIWKKTNSYESLF